MPVSEEHKQRVLAHLEGQYTPGPWRIGTVRRDGDISINSTSKAAVNLGEMTVALAYELWDRDGGRAVSMANARLIAAAPDYDAAAGLAITALAFEQERAHRAGDELAYRQITTAKNALIAAQNKARGRGQPAMRDVTPAGIAKAERV